MATVGCHGTHGSAGFSALHGVSQWAEQFGLRVGLLVGSLSASEKSKIKRYLKSGQLDIVVGTHALIQEDTSFKDLGLVIIDEQHRFGVYQRAALINMDKSNSLTY